MSVNNEELGSISIMIHCTHPDYQQAKRESRAAKRVSNSILAITRNRYFYKRDGENADLKISQEYGVDVTLDEFKYSKNYLGLAKIYGPVRTIVAPFLHSKIAQTISRSIAGMWSSYWGLWKAGLKPGLPKYSKQEYGVVPYPLDVLSKVELRGGIVKPTTWSTGVNIPEFARDVRSARLVPVSADKFELKILYVKHESIERIPITHQGMAGLDFGIKNLMTIAFDSPRPAIIISGAPIMSTLYKKNTFLDVACSQRDTEREGVKRKNDGRFVPFKQWSRISNLYWSSHIMIKNYYTLVNNRVVQELRDAGVGTLVIGWSNDFKKGSRLGRFTNRKFMGVPHAAIRDDLVYKCERAGITVVIVEESYTSKSSWWGEDELPVYDENNPRSYSFSGSRIKRGLYKNNDGSLMNADVNGALNIIRKYDPSFTRSNSGFVKPPRVERLKLLV